MVKFNLILLSILSLIFLSKNVMAVTAESVKACETGDYLFTGSSTACRFTPQSYIASVFEMGLCTTNPMSGDSLDRSTCTTVFTASDQINGSQHDFAPGDVELIGTSTRPTNGTYGYPYIILSNDFSIKGEYSKGGTTYYITASSGQCNAVNTTGPAEQCSSSLVQFAQTAACDGEYTGARFEGGILNGYLMQNSTLDKRLGASEGNAGQCTNVDRLVGVMELDTPLIITQSVINFKFTFNVTGYGAQLFTDQTPPTNITDGGGGSGPFSGFFTITNAPQQ